MSAEFDFSPNGFIEVDDYSYSKNDVFEEIENEQFSQRISYHKRLWQAKDLLALLEENILNPLAVNSDLRGFSGDKEFDLFFSPYFSGSFSYVSRTALNDLDFLQLAGIFQFEDFLQPAEREEAFRPVRIFFDENLRLFNNISADNYNSMRPRIIHWITSSWAGFMNSLPTEFYDSKIAIVLKLVNISVGIQKSNRQDCIDISDKLVALKDMPENLSGTILRNHSVYNSRKTTSFSGYGWLIWAVIILIKIIVFSGC